MTRNQSVRVTASQYGVPELN